MSFLTSVGVTSEKHSHVVVGAGLPGITLSLALAKNGCDVVLIDAAPEIGGLLRSYEIDGFIFDFGTHFASRTGVDDIDELLFGGVESDWVNVPVLRAGNFWNGILNSASESPNLNTLGKEGHNQCLAEMLQSAGWHKTRKPNNAQEYLLAKYGPHLVAKFFDPVFKKFTGLSSEKLHYEANMLFGLKRFAVLDAQATTELKYSDRYDAIFAFHHREHFSNHRVSLYPRIGGMGKWIEQLEDKLRISGVRVLTDAKIDYIKIAKGAVTGLVVDGAEIELDSLTWSVAPDQFCKMVGIELATTKPLNRITVLVGMEFDQTFLTDCHFVTIFDTEFAAFRITFYSNFRTHSAGRYGATVEFLVDPDGVSNTDWALLAESEMRKMGVVGATTKVISRHERVVRNGFPIQSNDNTDSTAAQVEKIREYSNVNVIGRASGDGWFLEDLIKKAYSVASELNV